MNERKHAAIERIARFSLTSADAAGLAAFYEQAFGCRRIGTDRLEGPEFEQLMDVPGGARRITLGLGAETIELLQFDRPGRSYPVPSSVSDLVFQHFAIIVADMAQAYEHLCSIEHWSAISRDGPQMLPTSSGGVTAFKFRDPEGHPLELLAFPKGNTPIPWRSRGVGLYLGIDHSAISIADVVTSVAFYESLGFRVCARSYNHGIEQGALDNLADAQVDVVALASACEKPHLELLCYRSVMRGIPITMANNDIASTRLILQLEEGEHRNNGGPSEYGVRDPNGHRLMIISLVK